MTEIALQLLRKEDKIDACELARRLGMSEVTARQYIAEAQRKGVIPFKADIVEEQRTTAMNSIEERAYAVPPPSTARTAPVT